jgi:amino acid adenylation domain-containing protein
MLIHQYIEAHSIRRSDALALRFRQNQFTYAQLNLHANQLARHLNSLGVSSEDRVAVCLEPSSEIVVSLLAILKAGGVYVPLDPSYPAERLADILTETQPKVLITQAHLLPDVPVIAEHTFCIDQDWQTIQQLSSQKIENKISLTQTAYIIYTSGTTGKPKGVMVSHSNLLHYILVAQEKYGFNCQDVMPAIARFSFSISLFELLSPLVAGGTLLILERDHILDFEQMTRILEQVTAIHAGPSLLRSLLAYIEEKNLSSQKFQSLRHVSTGGDMVLIDILEQMKKVFQYAEIFVIYGCTEVSCMGCTYLVPREGRLTKSLVGKNFSHVSIRLYDEAQNLVSIGTTGEIYIGGVGVAKGYLYREELTQTKFVFIDGERFYRTGDIGRFNENDNLEMLGRSDFQIKLRGIRIELGEIETILNRHPAVKQNLVIGREDIPGDIRLIAYVVIDQTLATTISELRTFLKKQLPDYMVPNTFVFLDTMPLNPNGKIDRHALPSPDSKKYLNEEFIVPRDAVEQQLANIWVKHLGLQAIGVHDDFFDLGGHSLLFANLISEIEEFFSYEFPVESFFQVNTIEEMAHWIREKICDKISLDKDSSSLFYEDYRAFLRLCYSRIGKHIGRRGLFVEIIPDTIKSYQPFIWIGYIDFSKNLGLKQPIYTIPGCSWTPFTSTKNYIENIASVIVDELLTAQPEGPYLLGGNCYEGLIALEIAQQLQAQGKEVVLLSITDPPEPSNIYRFCRKLDFYYCAFRFHLLELLPLALIDKIKYIGKRLVRNTDKHAPKVQSERASNKTQDEYDRILPLTWKSLKQSARSYLPKEYAGKIVLTAPTKSGLRSGTKDLLWADLSWLFPYLGWGRLFTGKVELHNIQCAHSDLGMRQYAEEIGRIIWDSSNDIQ